MRREKGREEGDSGSKTTLSLKFTADFHNGKNCTNQTRCGAGSANLFHPFVYKSIAAHFQDLKLKYQNN